MTSATPHTTHKTMTQSIARIDAIQDQELDFETLMTISGGGKEAKTKVGKWFEKTFGNGDGEHTFGDYADEIGAIIIAIGKKKGGSVHQPPGSEEPEIGTWH